MQRISKSRPQIPSANVDETSSLEEQFQNQTLRPVIKMQHELLMAFFKQYLKEKKNQYFQLTADKRVEYIKNAFSKDIQFRNVLKGLIVGQFNIEEYQAFCKIPSAINKRIITITQERILTNLEELQMK
jgi:hypothetical protein